MGRCRAPALVGAQRGAALVIPGAVPHTTCREHSSGDPRAADLDSTASADGRAGSRDRSIPHRDGSQRVRSPAQPDTHRIADRATFTYPSAYGYAHSYSGCWRRLIAMVGQAFVASDQISRLVSEVAGRMGDACEVMSDHRNASCNATGVSGTNTTHTMCRWCAGASWKASGKVPGHDRAAE